MDDLLDLDFASSSKPQPASKPSPQANYGSGRTAFDYLAAPSRQAPAQPMRPVTLQSGPQAAPKPSPAGGDAFAELFGTSSSSSSSGPAPANNGLSMAERLHKESTARLAAYGNAASRSGASSPCDSLASPAALSPQSRTASPYLVPNTRPGVPSAGKTPTSRSASPAQPPLAPSAAADAWNLDLLEAAVPARQSPLATVRTESPVDDLFDMGFDGTRFAPAVAGTASAPPPVAPSTDEFDLLDAFAGPAKPGASSSPADSSLPSAASRQTSGVRGTRNAPSPTPRKQASAVQVESPPPHIVGRLVEMGFAPAAATAALAATRPSGNADWSVDAALEVLVQEQLDEETRRQKQREADEWGDEDNIRIGRRRSWQQDDDDVSPATSAPSRNLAEPAAQHTKRFETSGRGVSARTVPARSRSGAEPSRAADSADPDSAREQARVLQEQANEVLAQAQKIGLSMFKSANAYWGEGKKALQKALDEQRAAARAGTAAAGGGGGAGPANGKPKWWREGMDGGEEEGDSPARGAPKGKGRAEASPSAGFKDSDDDEDGPEPATRTRLNGLGRPAPSPSEAPPPAAEYRSPFRRAKPAPAPAAAEADLLSESSLATPATAAARPPSQHAPPPSSRSNAARTGSASPRPPAPKRQLVTVPASALASASKHKAAGNEHFKLGRFGDATASFSLALNALPEEWIGCVPLLNNRAQARLRSGEEKEAVMDCSAALAILLAPTQGAYDLAALEAESAALPAEVGQLFSAGAAIDWKDQLGKSLARRARANEANEKWALAGDDWQKLLTLGDDVVTRGAGGIRMISDGVARCKQMLDGPAPSRKPTPAARAGPRPIATGTGAASQSAAVPRKPAAPIEGSGEAVRALQAQQAALAAEDDLRLQLKDQVDAQIAAWKGGKETNLRALIASLDAVLWPGLGWKTVGMHELISENQLKVRYVRAIAKVHPDK
ncbi:hypothetical protein JCM3774_006354, partial [Rhodotorula dairenensis]